MNRIAWWVGPLAAILATCVLVPVIVWHSAQSRIPIGFYEPSPHVRLESGIGQGSGVHIGNGLVLTAAHVVGKNKDIKAFADDNRVVDDKAEVLWTNTKYDIALVRLAKPKLRAAHLSCEPNFTTQAVWAYGNPLGVQAVYTKAEVVGPAREWLIWASVVPVAGPIIYGQSGGGVMDEKGDLVGIAVGVLMTQGGIASFGWVVPAQTVCQLMGRA